MTLDNKYIINEDSVKDVLDKVENFLINYDKFVSKHNKIDYKINIFKTKNKWTAEIMI